ncbi:MAG: hypothetical protein HKN18_03680 [Silicimonas sp.]|nr:hypothetical protein [Silicimonas sp.]
MRNVCSRPLERAPKPPKTAEERAEFETMLAALRAMRLKRCAERRSPSLSLQEAA